MDAGLILRYPCNTVDLLTDVLTQAGLRRRFLDLRDLPAATTLRFPCDKSIGFHVVVVGRAFIHTSQSPAVISLRAGDVVLMARGQHHLVSTQEQLPATSTELDVWSSRSSAADPSPAASVVSGAYQLWHSPLHPMFQELPDWFVLPAETENQLSPLSLAISLLAQESTRCDLGSSTVMHSLLDVIFAFIMRRIVAERGAQAQSWSRALRDDQVRRAIELMHEDCAHAWTLVELAQKSGISRTAMAARFRSTMGDTPLNYLRAIRVQTAMRLLCETDDSLEQVAAAIGYADAFAFSKVFKRTVGIAPRQFRQKNTAESAHPYRFVAQAGSP